jgi:hypothetical protein
VLDKLWQDCAVVFAAEIHSPTISSLVNFKADLPRLDIARHFHAKQSDEHRLESLQD